MISEVDIRADLLPRHRSVFSALHHLSIQLPPDAWCIVGGMMVYVVGAAHGRLAPRASATKDADLLVDVVAKPSLLIAADHILHAQGFTLADKVGSGDAIARCTYVFGAAQIDLLCPNRFGRLNRLRTALSTCFEPTMGRWYGWPLC